jgi:hypothetical protein
MPPVRIFGKNVRISFRKQILEDLLPHLSGKMMEV